MDIAKHRYSSYSGYLNIDTNDFDLPVTYGAIAVKISKNEASDKTLSALANG